MSTPPDPQWSSDDPNPSPSGSSDPPPAPPSAPPQQQPPMYAGPPGYPYPPHYYAPPQRTNGLAVASLVLGIVWVYWIGSILALIFGYVARNQIRERQESGGGMATAGIVLGWVGIGVLAAAFLAAGIASSASS